MHQYTYFKSLLLGNFINYLFTLQELFANRFPGKSIMGYFIIRNITFKGIHALYLTAIGIRNLE